MKIKSIFKLSLIALLPGIMLGSCTSKKQDAAAQEDDSATRVEAVRVQELAYREISRTATYTAHLQAFKEVHLASASPGRIERITVEAGQRFSQGQVLVEMDKTQLKQAEIQLASLEVEFQRLDTLRKAGSISQQQFDQVKTQYDMAKSNVEFLMENTRLVAPFSGAVSGKYYENGEMFSGAPNTQAGKAAILSLVQTSRLKAIVNVAERYYPQIKRGLEVKITTDVFPGEVFLGTVSMIYPTIDPATRSFKVELTVPNAQEKLRPGMFARATLELDQVKVFLVPALAILKLQGSNERYIFLEESGKAKRVAVELGDRFDDMVELITDEIKPGDRVIVAGQARLVDGAAVSVEQ
ncbi:MAG: efflux RND transporter periplasmic adaptor subunit [Bacteroides sp.]|jgi:RND family efflux transporter MFP subunit|nr:efflux RND transporter periplasmic adaptor subunit [Bacteroides sp.]